MREIGPKEVFQGLGQKVTPLTRRSVVVPKAESSTVTPAKELPISLGIPKNLPLGTMVYIRSCRGGQWIQQVREMVGKKLPIQGKNKDGYLIEGWSFLFTDLELDKQIP